MYSFNFPNMLSESNANLIKDREAVDQNLINFLNCTKRELFGDPYFGCNMKKLLFEQQNTMIKDLFIDELYTAIITFIPQITLSRNDILIYVEDDNIFTDINYIYLEDNTANLLQINLTADDIY